MFKLLIFRNNHISKNSTDELYEFKNLFFFITKIRNILLANYKIPRYMGFLSVKWKSNIIVKIDGIFNLVNKSRKDISVSDC